LILIDCLIKARLYPWRYHRRLLLLYDLIADEIKRQSGLDVDWAKSGCGSRKQDVAHTRVVRRRICLDHFMDLVLAFQLDLDHLWGVRFDLVG
jgi:hypothetical protein